MAALMLIANCADVALGRTVLEQWCRVTDACTLWLGGQWLRTMSCFSFSSRLAILFMLLASRR
jgi:hypothetical protein